MAQEKFIVISLDRIWKTAANIADARQFIADYKLDLEATQKPGDPPRSSTLVVARVVAGESRRFVTRTIATTEETSVEVE